jgi:hypothetical protein
VITAVMIVAAGQCLLPLDPPPKPAEIARVVNKIGAAFDVSADVTRQAYDFWLKKIANLTA